MIRKIIFTGLVVCVSIAHAEEMFVKKSFFSQYEAVVEEREPLNNVSTVGGYPILNVGEELTNLLSNVSDSTGVAVKMGRTVLFAVKDGKHHVSIDMLANLERGNMSNWTDDPCKRDDFIWKRSTGGKFSDVNCVSINHVVDYFVRPTGRFEQVVVWARKEQIEIPPTIVRVTFTRLGDGGRYLRYIVDINPEQYGIARDAATPWGSNGWYKDFINEHNDRVEFIEKLKKWATNVQDSMDEAFKKNKDAFEKLKPLNEYLNEQKVSSTDKENTGEKNKEEKLKELKDLFDKKLLTEDLYKEQVRQILSK